MRNVALIVLDTVRKDTFDERAPRLRALSDTSFEQCRAASSWSTPSHTSIFTGRLPSEHGVHSESFDASFSFARFDADETFLGDLPEHRRIGLSANSYVNRAFDFDALFDEFYDFSIGSHTNETLFTEGLAVQEYMESADEPNPAKRYLGFLRACLDHERPAKSLANGVWSQVNHRVKTLPVPEFVDDGAKNISATATERAEAVDEPVFLFANFMDAHTPLRNLIQYDQSLHSAPNSWSSNELDKWELNKEGLATEEYARNYRELYAAAVDYLDRIVSRLVVELQAKTDREWSFVIVSDHGHNLGYEADDGLFHHTGSMTEGVMHTPCEIVGAPEGYPTRVTEYVSQLELGELLVRLANGDPYADDLAADHVVAETIGLLGHGDRTWGREFTDEEYDFWNRMIRVAYEGETKLEWDSLGRCIEYDLDPERPSWQREVATHGGPPPEVTALFEIGLREYKEAAAAGEQDLEFDESVEEQLKELGYL
ncbi:sulfatase-like hydrolase/transferase [Halegenticoccus soli]|uniref:sulfatase-like hydrolase/transferase n=1 Tax=Halegenticoccus soli TaxID=1985678 RepID=UPI000C6E545F|nr:sulfatase-like hydrolase/transferase [Halegenticoccus soli]